jgi:hypothetical protein
VAKYQIIHDDEGNPVEVRVELDDGRIACAGIEDGRLRENTDIPNETVRTIKKELRA